MEFILLTTAETSPDNTKYHIAELNLKWSLSKIEIVLEGENGEEKRITYRGSVAKSLMQALNKLDLSTISLVHRIQKRLLNDGHLQGTDEGVPD